MISKNYLRILVELLFLLFLYTPLLPTAAGFSKTLDLYLNDDELFIATLTGFPALFIEIHLFQIPINFEMYLNNYHYIQSNCT